MGRILLAKALTGLLLYILPTDGTMAQGNLPLNRDVVFAVDKYLGRPEAKVLTTLKPYREQMVLACIRPDSALTPGSRNAFKRNRWITRKIFNENLFVVNFNDFHLYIDPLFNFSFGRSFDENLNLYTNTRGVQIKGNFGSRLYFVTGYYETQARFPSYVGKFISRYEVAPGDGRTKNFRKGAWDYGTPYGLVAYSPDAHWNIQFGFDKNFIGDGYRSLLLSDNTFAYPFLKIFMNYKWFYYQCLYTSFQNLNTPGVLDAPLVWYHGYQTKPGTFNFAGFRIGKIAEIGLFEGIMWEASGKGVSINPNMFDPVIFINTAIFGGSNKVNTLAGLTLKLKPHRMINLYGQLMIDDADFGKLFTKGYQRNTFGFQAGARIYDIGLQNLNLQIEYNQVRPYTYAHRNPLQSYTHFNQPLAHPMGANFKELLGFLNYRYRRIFAEISFMSATTGLDMDSLNTVNWGQNVFLSQNSASRGYNSQGNFTGQGVSTYLTQAGVRISYLFNPKTNLRVEASWGIRLQNNYMMHEQSQWFFVSLQTALTNVYHDFFSYP